MHWGEGGQEWRRCQVQNQASELEDFCVIMVYKLCVLRKLSANEEKQAGFKETIQLIDGQVLVTDWMWCVSKTVLRFLPGVRKYRRNGYDMITNCTLDMLIFICLQVISVEMVTMQLNSLYSQKSSVLDLEILSAFAFTTERILIAYGP